MTPKVLLIAAVQASAVLFWLALLVFLAFLLGHTLASVLGI